METPATAIASERLSVIPSSRFERVLFAFIVTFLPGLAFWGIEMTRPEWQSGQTEDYVALLINPEAAFLFFPLLAYAILAYWLLLLAEQRFAAKFWVRLGIYTGILLAGQYIILAAIFTPFSVVVGLGITFTYWITKRISLKLGRLYALGFVLILILFGAGIQSGFAIDSFADLFLRPTELLFLALIGLGVGSPVLCFSIALPSGLRLWQSYEQPFIWSVTRSIGLFSWLAGFAAAWTVSIYRMIELYNALPPEPPPDCYIATAAARGHPGFVGSQPVARGTATLMVNRQLQTLKLAELALMATAPNIHRPLRGLYDALGYPLARSLTHPILADLAYLALKPAELVSRASLRAILPDLELILSRLYR